MGMRLVAAVLSVLGLVILLTSPPAQSQDAADNDEGIFDQVALLKNDELPKPEDGVQPLGKGPVHEAFAEPVSNTAPQAPAIVPKQPPELIEELPPEEKPDGDNVQWISGYWAWDEDGQDFLWISGIWRNIPPGRQWVPGHFKQGAQATDGWQWVAGFWTTADQGEINVVPMPPPEPVNEAEPPRPSENATYVAGHWVYHQTRYVWRPGFWCPYRAGWVWVPAHYVWTPCGFVFVDGYWDFSLQERGLLFAPCHIDHRVRFAGGFRFTPRFVVNDHCLMGALFVRPRHGCYFFGDFFEARYQRLGFTSFVDIRIGRGGCDPLFGYYRAHHHRNPGWERNLHELYHARRLGTAPRPPVTLVQQNTIINNINVNKNVNIKNVNNVVMIAPVTKVNQKVVKLDKLDNTRRIAEQKQSDKLREVGKQRAKQETVLLASRDTNRKDDTVRNLKLDLPEKKDKDSKFEASRKKAPPPSPLVLKKDDRVVEKKTDDKKGDDKARLPDNKKPEDKKADEKKVERKLDDKKTDDKKTEKKPDDKARIPEIKKPDEKKPDGKKPEEKKLEKKPDEKKPDGKKPDEKKPDGKKPDEKKPDGKKPEEKKPEKKPEERKIDKKPEEKVKIQDFKKVEEKKPDRNSGGNNNKPPEIKKSDSFKPAKSNDNNRSNNNNSSNNNKKDGKKK